MPDTTQSRRAFMKIVSMGAGGMALSTRVSWASSLATPPPRRFVIDSHQHYQAAPDYVERLIKTYRPRNAMACLLTPMAGFEVLKKAAADYPDVVIPYGFISVDDPQSLSEIQKFADAGFKGIKMHRPRNN